MERHWRSERRGRRGEVGMLEEKEEIGRHWRRKRDKGRRDEERVNRKE